MTFPWDPATILNLPEDRSVCFGTKTTGQRCSREIIQSKRMDLISGIERLAAVLPAQVNRDELADILHIIANSAFCVRNHESQRLAAVQGWLQKINVAYPPADGVDGVHPGRNRKRARNDADSAVQDSDGDMLATSLAYTQTRRDAPQPQDLGLEVNNLASNQVPVTQQHRQVGEHRSAQQGFGNRVVLGSLSTPRTAPSGRVPDLQHDQPSQHINQVVGHTTPSAQREDTVSNPPYANPLLPANEADLAEELPRGAREVVARQEDQEVGPLSRLLEGVFGMPQRLLFGDDYRPAPGSQPAPIPLQVQSQPPARQGDTSESAREDIHIQHDPTGNYCIVQASPNHVANADYNPIDPSRRPLGDMFLQRINHYLRTLDPNPFTMEEVAYFREIRDAEDYRCHLQAEQQTQAAAERLQGVVERRPIQGECPVCLEDMDVDDVVNIDWCKKGCGNNIHTVCLNQWKARKDSCITCKEKW